MELPVIGGRGAATSEALIRAVRKSGVELSRAIAADEQTIDGGVAFTNPACRAVADANAVRDVHLPAGMRPAEALSEADLAFSGPAHCAMLVPTEARLDDAWRSLLADRGFAPSIQSLLLMQTVVEPQPDEAAVQVISARAVVAEYRAFLKRVFTARGHAADIAKDLALCEAGFLDVDALDVLVARAGGRIMASVGAMTVAEFGIFRGLYIEPGASAHIVNTLLWHLLDLCKRSQFRQIIAAVQENDDETTSLFGRLGMKSIATIESYIRPGVEVIT